MKRKIIFVNSTLWLATMAVAIVLLIAAAVFSAKVRAKAAKAIDDAQKAVATAQKSENDYAATSEEGLAELRQSAERFKNTLLTSETIKRLEDDFGQNWAWVPRDAVVTDDYRKQVYAVSHGPFSESEWMSLFQFIEKLQRTDAVAIRAIDIETQGSSMERSIASVTLNIVLYVQK